MLTDEHPLRKLVSLEILKEQGGVLDLSRTFWLSDDGVEENFWARSMLISLSYVMYDINLLVFSDIVCSSN